MEKDLTTVSVGQAVGARGRRRAALAAGFGVLTCITVQFTTESIVALFTDLSMADGAAAVHLSGQYLRGYIFDCIFASIHFSFSGYFRARGRTGPAFPRNILAIALVRIPGVYLTSKLFPATLLSIGTPRDSNPRPLVHRPSQSEIGALSAPISLFFAPLTG